MPKMKTKKACAKRLKLTASGGLKYKRSKLRHHLTGRTTDSKRKCRLAGYIENADLKRMLKALPNR